ncbi:hypothetical protein GCM10008965_26110 [Methylorubrum aminovorans]|nr:hypothetical protein GCM10025880_04400 [Methylorubrum aminovorans]
MAQRFPDNFEPAQSSQRSKDVGRVAALASTAFQEPALPCQCERRVEEPAFRPMGEKAGAELAQDSVVEAGIGELQAQEVLPVDPRADCVGGLAIGESLHELQQGREGEPDRRLSGASPHREQVGKVVILHDLMQVVIEAHDRIAVRKDRSRDLRSLIRHDVGASHVERHAPLLMSVGQHRHSSRCAGRPLIARCRAEFATNIKVRESRCRGALQAFPRGVFDASHTPALSS